MTPIPQMDYSLLYHERTLRSVANSTRDDVRQCLHLAAEVPVRTEVQVYDLADANRVVAGPETQPHRRCRRALRPYQPSPRRVYQPAALP
jgi:D-arabinose 1-dehydrogenase-like Zn-dependent alcohol dehydrogenase